jgi:peptidoglycan-associated lipoprotein
MNFAKLEWKEAHAMKRFIGMLVLVTLCLAAIVLMGTGCTKKVTAPPAVAKTEPPSPQPPQAAPTITLSASPTAIERGQSSTITWNTTNASNVTISGGIGTVEASGSRSVSPAESTTYTARAGGPGGSGIAEARITVTEPSTVTPPPIARIGDAEFFAANIKDIFFDFDRHDIREDAQATLQSDARVLSDPERTRLRFSIEGHCDERGSEKYNLALGDRRANAAKEYLTKQGINADRIDTISYGKERPFCTEQNEDCWQQNRRAHFVLKQ